MASIPDQPRVFRQGAAPDLRNGPLPRLPSLLQLGVVYIRDVDAILDRIDHDGVAVSDQRDRTPDCGFGSDVSDLGENYK